MTTRLKHIVGGRQSDFCGVTGDGDQSVGYDFFFTATGYGDPCPRCLDRIYARAKLDTPTMESPEDKRHRELTQVLTELLAFMRAKMPDSNGDNNG